MTIINEDILTLEPEVKKKKTTAKSPKTPKERYVVGEFLKRGAEKFKILEISESFYKVFSLDTNEQLTIAKTGLKKFKPGQKDLASLESFEKRLNFTQPREEVELLDLVEFPNEENLKALNAATEIGFDIETFGTLKQDDAFYPEKGEIRLMQVYLSSIDKCIVWDSGDIRNNKPLSELPGIDILKKKLNSPKCKVYIHNADFENKWIANKLRIPINNVVDSLILSQIYWAGLARGFNSCGISKPNSLEQVALRVLNVKPDKTNQSYDYALPLGNSQYNYAALDAKLTYQCGVKLLEMCYAEGLQRVVDADLSAIPAFAMMNYKGIPVNKQILLELREDYQKAAEDAIKPWMDLFPGTNPGSWMQVAKNLKDKWGIEPKATDPKTGQEKIATDNATLTPYALENPVIDQLLFYRSLTKDVEYIDGYLEHVINVDGFDVIRPNYSQNAENCTGRTSSRKPNMQNIPKLTKRRKNLGLKAIRSAFVAPPGYKMIIVDLAGSHGQIARYVAKDKKLIEANELGIKVHFYTVQGMLELEGKNVSVEELVKAKEDDNHPLAEDLNRLYDPAKTVFYGGLNMQSARTLQNTFLKKTDTIVPLDVCKNYIEGGRLAYKDVYQLQKKLIYNANSAKEARQFTYNDEDGNPYKVGSFRGFYGTARSVDGGRLFIEKTPNKYNKGAWECKGTDAVSYMWLRVEGTIMKKAIGTLVKWLRENKIPGWICQQTHDEQAVIVKEGHEVEVAQYMINMITATFQEFIPDYKNESDDPYKYICKNNTWADK